MPKIRSATRLALIIGFSCATIVWIAAGLGMIPDPSAMELSKRVDMVKGIAVNVTTFAEDQRGIRLQTILDRTVGIDEDLISIGVSRLGRGHIVTSGPHTTTWAQDNQAQTREQISVEIMSGSKKWGDLEVAFVPLHISNPVAAMSFPYGLIAFIAASMSLLGWAVISKSLRYLNPSNVVPNRVRSALDTLAEELVLVDKSGEIAHANQAFQTLAKIDASQILGMQLDDFGWTKSADAIEHAMPWTLCANMQSRILGEIVQLKVPNAPTRKFVVNATPIFDGDDSVRGALVSFDDVTAIENKNAELGSNLRLQSTNMKL